MSRGRDVGREGGMDRHSILFGYSTRTSTCSVEALSIIPCRS